MLSNSKRQQSHKSSYVSYSRLILGLSQRLYYSFKSSGLLDRLEASNKYVLPFELEKQFHDELEEEIKRVEQESKKKIKESLRIGEEIGFKKGREQEIEHIARQMLKDRTPIDHIVRWTGLNVQEIGKFKKE